MRDFLLVLWQLPQVLLGFLLYVGFGLKYYTTYKKEIIVYTGEIRWGVSLGLYILLGNSYMAYDKERTLAHEYGHCKQSLYLGPLYLLIVGLPSILMNILSTILAKLGKSACILNYYNRWPESWADRLGGVKHNPDGTRSV